MHFKLVYGNHSHHGVQMGDTLLMLKYGLEGLGYRADIERDFQPGYINVLMEQFTDEYVDLIEGAWTADTRMVIIATEFLTGDTFNNYYNETEAEKAEVKREDHYVKHAMWQRRYNNFAKMVQRSAAVWHLSHYQADLFAEKFTELPVGFLPHGYSEKFATVEHVPDDDKDIDVLFTGTLTSYRKAVLDSLRDAGVVVEVQSVFTPSFHREELIGRSKLTVNIKQHPNWKYESNSRLFYHLSNDSLILTETCTYPSDIHPYVLVSGDDMAADVLRILDEGHYTEKAQRMGAHFAKERDMQALLPGLLQHSGLS